jgi:nucleoid-associated protein YgaU
MRAYAVMEELPDDEEYSRVVPILSGSRVRTAPLGRPHPQPWTPRDASAPPVVRQSTPTPSSEPRFTRTQQWMIGAFAIICIGMILGMLMVRLWDEASRTLATIPTAAALDRAEAPAPAVQPAVSQPVGTPAPAGTPVISTEIHVLQPNYTVAPGDTLGSIARKNGTSVDALASINNLENRNSLSIGQKLIIP